MGRAFEMVYEHGVLRPLEPVPFKENERVTVTVSEAEKEAVKPYNAREREMAWLQQHAKEYPGEWVALDGDRLVAHHKDGREMYRMVDEAGVELPIIAHIPPADEPPFGGW